MALVDVFVEVFDSRDGGADLHVDVAIEDHQEKVGTNNALK